MRSFFIFALFGYVLAQADTSCECYLATGSAGGYYINHHFFDFRNISDGGDYSREPANVTNSQNQGSEPAQSGYLSSSAFTSAFDVQTWAKASTEDNPIALRNSMQNVYIQTSQDADSDSSTHLTLRTYRQQDFSSAAEMENRQKNLLHGSFRIRARIRGDPGAVAGIFTYGSDTAELDIEILTRDPDNVFRYTNQPSADKHGNTVAAAETDYNATGISREEWHEHRIDWNSKLVAYLLDGDTVAEKSYSVPKIASYLDLNMWSDGGSWSGNMTVGSAAYLDVEYIEMAFNTSGKAKKGHCNVVCTIDNVTTVGVPEILSISPATATVANRALVWTVALGLGLLLI